MKRMEGRCYPPLCRSTVYQVVVSASNKHGWSDQSELFTFSTRDTGDMVTTLPLTVNIFIFRLLTVQTQELLW